MNKDHAELVAAMTTAALGALGIVAMAVRFVLLPWLRDHLVAPLLCRLDTLSADMVRLSSDTKVAAIMYEGHIEASTAELARLWGAIRSLEHHNREGHHDDH